MKLKIQGFDMEIPIRKDRTCILVIEDIRLFSNIVQILSNNIKEKTEEVDIILLDDNDTCVSLHKNVRLYMDVINVDIYDKKVMTKIYKQIVYEVQQNIEVYTDIQYLCNTVNSKLLPYILDIDLNLVYDEEVMLEIYLKAINLRIDDDIQEMSIYDRICYIVDLEAQMQLHECILFVNVLMFLVQEEIENLISYCSSKNIRILFLERNECHVKESYIRLIDTDFVEHICDQF